MKPLLLFIPAILLLLALFYVAALASPVLGAWGRWCDWREAQADGFQAARREWREVLARGGRN